MNQNEPHIVFRVETVGQWRRYRLRRRLGAAAVILVALFAAPVAGEVHAPICNSTAMC